MISDKKYEIHIHRTDGAHAFIPCDLEIQDWSGTEPVRLIQDAFEELDSRPA